MRYTFTLQDEKTLTNETVKVFIKVTGPADAERSDLEARARERLEKLLPDADWVFTGLEINRAAGYPLFTTTASARIPVGQNDNLHQKARDLSTKKVDLNFYTRV